MLNALVIISSFDSHFIHAAIIVGKERALLWNASASEYLLLKFKPYHWDAMHTKIPLFKILVSLSMNEQHL